MDVLHRQCAGLDVHKDTVVACVRKVDERGRVQREVRTFGTTTTSLGELSEWLEAEGCTHAAMEATGVYWKPVWHLLEGTCELVLANAQHVRNVPGRKSDVNDATWLADLLAHGLIRGSFVPDRPIQELRDLTRTRKQLMRERAQHLNRLQKVLEDANVKLGSVIADVVGVSGRAILNALVDGETDPEQLAAKANRRLKASHTELVEALRGKVTAHHRFLLRLHLEQVDALDRTVKSLDERIEEVGRPFSEPVKRLVTLPGVSRTAAWVLVAELGVDMTRFETPQRLVSFATLCPRLDESAGKARSTRLRRGSTWLKTTIVSCGWAAARSKDTYYRAQFQRLKARRGPQKAVIAVAASLLTAAFFILRDGTTFRDLGANYFDRLNKDLVAKRLRQRLENLGYTVQLTRAAA